MARYTLETLKTFNGRKLYELDEREINARLREATAIINKRLKRFKATDTDIISDTLKKYQDTGMHYDGLSFNQKRSMLADATHILRGESTTVRGTKAIRKRALESLGMSKKSISAFSKNEAYKQFWSFMERWKEMNPAQYYEYYRIMNGAGVDIAKILSNEGNWPALLSLFSSYVDDLVNPYANGLTLNQYVSNIYDKIEDKRGANEENIKAFIMEIIKKNFNRNKKLDPDIFGADFGL